MAFFLNQNALKKKKNHKNETKNKQNQKAFIYTKIETNVLFVLEIWKINKLYESSRFSSYFADIKFAQSLAVKFSHQLRSLSPRVHSGGEIIEVFLSILSFFRRVIREDGRFRVNFKGLLKAH